MNNNAKLFLFRFTYLDTITGAFCSDDVLSASEEEAWELFYSHLDPYIADGGMLHLEGPMLVGCADPEKLGEEEQLTMVMNYLEDPDSVYDMDEEEFYSVLIKISREFVESYIDEI